MYEREGNVHRRHLFEKRHLGINNIKEWHSSLWWLNLTSRKVDLTDFAVSVLTQNYPFHLVWREFPKFWDVMLCNTSMIDTQKACRLLYNVYSYLPCVEINFKKPDVLTHCGQYCIYVQRMHNMSRSFVSPHFPSLLNPCLFSFTSLHENP